MCFILFSAFQIGEELKEQAATQHIDKQKKG